MGDAFVKMALAKDCVGLGKVGVALAGVQLLSTALVSTAMVMVDAMAAERQHRAKKLSNPIVFRNHDEAKAEAKKK